MRAHEVQAYWVDAYSYKKAFTVKSSSAKKPRARAKKPRAKAKPKAKR